MTNENIDRIPFRDDGEEKHTDHDGQDELRDEVEELQRWKIQVVTVWQTVKVLAVIFAFIAGLVATVVATWDAILKTMELFAK